MYFSIIICCYNSSFCIQKTLKHIANQKSYNLSYEVILIDNNCSDNTVAIALDTWQQIGAKHSLRIIKEEKAGLNYARKTGIKNARAQSIIFCDDDNFLQEDFLSRAKTRLDSSNCIGILGGQSLAEYSTSLPKWFYEYSAGYAVGKQSETSGNINQRGYVWGSCMVIRTSLAKDIILSGDFLTTDRVQNKLSSGGDVEICLRARLLGYDIFYDEGLLFYHFIHERKLSTEYRDHLYLSFKESSKKLLLYFILLEVQKMGVLKRTLYILRSFLNLLLSIFLIEKKKFRRNYFLYVFALTGFYRSNYISQAEKQVRKYYFS